MPTQRERYESQLTEDAQKAFASHQIVQKTEDILRMSCLYEDGKENSTYSVQLTRGHFGQLIVTGDIGPVVFAHGPRNLEGLIAWMAYSDRVNSYVREKASIGTRVTDFRRFAPEEIRLEYLVEYRSDLLTEGTDIPELSLWMELTEDVLPLFDSAEDEDLLHALQNAAYSIRTDVVHGPRVQAQEFAAQLSDIAKLERGLDTDARAAVRRKITEFAAGLLSSEYVSQLRVLENLATVESEREWFELVYDEFGDAEIWPPPMVYDATLYYAHAAIRRAHELLEREAGVQAIIDLQALVGITEPRDQAERGWDAMDQDDRRSTMLAHRATTGARAEKTK